MPKPIEILDECASEIASTFRGYQAISEGLGINFLTAIERSLNDLIANPEIGRITYRDTRKVVLTRFPYIIYYFNKTDSIQLVAFQHAKRNPESVKNIIHERK